MSGRPPFLSLRLTATGALEAVILSGWTHSDPSGDPLLQVTLGTIYCHDLLEPFVRDSGALFKRVQELSIVGTFSSKIKWTNIFKHFPTVRTLAMDDHPWGDMLLVLTTARRLQDGRLSVAMPSLRVLRLSEFRFSLPADGYAPFNDLLDLAIFRCNYGIPLDEMRLSECKHATEKHVERLKEVVVDVEWDGWELETTTEEEEDDSEENYSDESDYGHRHRRW